MNTLEKQREIYKKSKAVRLKVGGIYINGVAGKTNPHRTGMYLGTRGRYPVFMHADGRVSQFAGDKRGLLYVGQIFDMPSLRAIFRDAENKHGEKAKRNASEILNEHREAGMP